MPIRDVEVAAPEEEGDRVEVPVYDAPLSAGPGTVGSDRIVAYGSFFERWLRQEVRIDPRRAFLAPVRGHSMAPLFHDGDLVLGERVETIDHDGIYAVAVGGDLYIKHVRRERGRLLLVSENEVYGTQPLDPDAEDVHVIGRIVRRITRIY